MAPLLGFNEPIAPATVTGSTFRMKDVTAGTWVTATVTYDGTLRRITLRPAALLAAGHKFTVYATSGIRDVAGNAYAGSSWSFTASGDTTRPTITGRTPRSGATGVSRTTNVLVTFNEAMRASTITTATFRLRDSVTGAIVTASVYYDATRRRATLNPSVTLAARRTYTVLISSSIRNKAGIRVSSSSWSFKTGG